jgi:hypothetical protein
MDTFSIKLEGLTFPNYINDNSKKNFRLMVDINHFNDDGKPQTTHVTFPMQDVWQWRDKNKRFYIPPTKPIQTGDKTVDLDMSVFNNNSAEFSETDLEIVVTQGKLHSIIVNIIDVHDKNFLETFEKYIKLALPIIFDAATGGVAGIIGNKLIGKVIGSFKGDDITNEILKQTAGKDKVLFKGGKFQSAYGKIEIKGKGVFKGKNDMTGDYKVNLSYTKITI